MMKNVWSHLVIGRFESSISLIADLSHTHTHAEYFWKIAEAKILGMVNGVRLDWSSIIEQIRNRKRLSINPMYGILADDRCDLWVQRLYYNVSVATKLWHFELISNLMTI